MGRERRWGGCVVRQEVRRCCFVKGQVVRRCCLEKGDGEGRCDGELRRGVMMSFGRLQTVEMRHAQTMH